MFGGGGDDTGDAEVCLFEDLADDAEAFSFKGLADVCECEWDLVDGIRIEKRLPRLVVSDLAHLGQCPTCQLGHDMQAFLTVLRQEQQGVWEL